MRAVLIGEGVVRVVAGDKAMEGSQSSNRFRRILRHSGNGGAAAHLKLDPLVSL